MDLFTYLMAKKGHNTHRDLFSYLLGKGEAGTYTTYYGTSLNISNTLQAKIKNIALEGNTSQDGTPTPEAPIPIKVVTGNNTITVRGSNLFDYKEHNGLTLDSNGRITTTKYYTQATTVIYKLKPNTKYTFSFRNRNMAFSNYGLSMTVNGTWVQTNTGKYTLTSDSNGEFAIKLGADSYNTIGKASTYIQLDEGTTVTEFVPYYTPQTYPISLDNIELVKIENYKDYIFKNETTSQYYNSNLDENAWYYSNLFTKINNYNGETITTDYISTTGGLDIGATIYYYNNSNVPIKITDTTLIQQLENINNNARSYKDTTIIECTSESTDNETIGFSGDIKVTSVGLGNSLNTSLLSNNIQEETNIDDMQEEANLDDVNEIEEQNEEPIENEEIEEPIKEEVS